MWLALQMAFKELWTLTKLLVFVLVLLLAWGIAQNPPQPKTPAAVVLQLPQELVAVLKLYTDNNNSAKKTG